MRTITILLASLSLSACGLGGGGGGVQSPAAVQGTWGADCSKPFVKFAGSQMTVFPDNTTYPLKVATLANGQLTVTYMHNSEEITEVYVVDGATINLDHGVYGGQEVTWHRPPMTKCG
jgi:hypothetical protein